MSYDLNSQRMLEVLRTGREKLSDKGIASADRRVSPLRLQTNLPRDDVLARLVETFAGLVGGLEADELTPKELVEADELVRTKYGTREWTYLLP
jgi:lipoate-protein ligase A